MIISAYGPGSENSEEEREDLCKKMQECVMK